MSEDIKAFVNPPNGPSYRGAFSIELINGAHTRHVPKTATVTDNVVQVLHGLVQQSMGGIDFYSENSPFGFGYNFIKCIRKGDGSLLWVNNLYWN